MFFNLCWIWSKKKPSVSSFYEENNFKPCLTKQLLNMFKLWCERGINQTISKPFKWKWVPPTTAHRFIFMQIKLIFALRLVLNRGTRQQGNAVYWWVGSRSCVKFVPYWVARDIHDQGFESNSPPSTSRGALLRLLSTLSRKYISPMKIINNAVKVATSA